MTATALLFAFFTGLCLSACTGFRAFVPPLILGLTHRFAPTWVPLGETAALLSNPIVLAALAFAVVIEFLGDKIPWVDHALDVVQVPIKMGFAGLLVAFLVPPEHAGWMLTLIGAAIGSGTALTVHSAKASVRVGSTAATGGILNPVISFVEEIAAVVGTLVSLFLWPLAILAFFWLMWRVFRYLFGRTGGNEGSIAKATPSEFWYRIALLGTWIYGKIYHRLQISGTEHLPAQGPYVVVGNHASMLDGFLLGTGNRLTVYIMVKKEAFANPITGWFLRKVCAFPVDRQNPDPATLRYCLKVLQQGMVLGLFPEGTRNRKGLIRPFKPGAIRLALKQKAPIVPAFLANTHRIMPDGTWLPRPVPISLKFGEPLDTKKLLEEGKTEEDMLKILYERVCALGRELTGGDVEDHSAEEPDEPDRTAAPVSVTARE